MNRKLTSLALLAILVTGGCSRQDSAADYVPGQKMTFPIKSAGTLEHLGARTLEDCKAPDAAIEQSCTDRVKRLVQTCLTPQPEIYQTEGEFRAAAKQYLTCVEPHEICQGVEIVRDEQLSLCRD